MNKDVVVGGVALVLLGAGVYLLAPKEERPETFPQLPEKHVGETSKPAQEEFMGYAISAISAGYRTYSDKYLSFRYPGDWEVHVYDFDGDSDREKRSTHFISQDLTWNATSEQPQEYEIEDVPSGYWLEVYEGDSSFSQNFDEELASKKAAQEAHGGWYKRISIDGREAIMDTIGTHGSYISANTHGEGAYSLRLHFPFGTEPEALQLLETILASVDLKKN